MATLVILRHPVTILAIDFNNPDNLTFLLCYFEFTGTQYCRLQATSVAGTIIMTGFNCIIFPPIKKNYHLIKLAVNLYFG